VISIQNTPKDVKVTIDAKPKVTTSAAAFISEEQLLDVTSCGGGDLELLPFFLVDIVHARTSTLIRT
jgi:hypothetical protein